jgi:hypothetical protein
MSIEKQKDKMIDNIRVKYSRNMGMMRTKIRVNTTPKFPVEYLTSATHLLFIFHAADTLKYQTKLRKRSEIIDLRNALIPRVRTHNQNMTIAARAIAERKTFGLLS